MFGTLPLSGPLSGGVALLLYGPRAAAEISPWTRDGAVRAYVVTMAPDVSGRIVATPIKDDQFVKKGDVLAKIGPSTYSIAVQSASTAVDLGAANAFPTGARLVTAEIADVEIEPR